MGYLPKVISGFSWQTALKVMVIGIGFIRIFFLARLLPPETFGVYAIVLVALGLLEAITETGINLTIIQSQHPIKYYIDTAWVISIIRGVLIALLMTGAGKIIAGIYQQPELFGLIFFASLVPIIKGFLNPTVGVLQKDFRFSTMALFQLGRYTIEATLAIVFVLIWPSVWSLVGALVGAALAEVATSHLLLKPAPKFTFLRSRAREILSGARSLTIQAALSYCVENIDDLLVGKLLGTHTLGLYHNGYSLTHKMIYEPAKSASHGLLPVYTKLQAEPHRLKRGFLRSTILVLGILIVAAAFLSVFAQPLVQYGLGNQWLGLIPIIGILALAALLQSVFSLVATYLYAGKHYQGITLSLVTQLLLLVLGLWWLSPSMGLVGAAWALVLARLASVPFLFWGILRSRSQT